MTDFKAAVYTFFIYFFFLYFFLFLPTFIPGYEGEAGDFNFWLLFGINCVYSLLSIAGSYYYRHKNEQMFIRLRSFLISTAIVVIPALFFKNILDERNLPFFLALVFTGVFTWIITTYLYDAFMAKIKFDSLYDKKVYFKNQAQSQHVHYHQNMNRGIARLKILVLLSLIFHFLFLIILSGIIFPYENLNLYFVVAGIIFNFYMLHIFARFENERYIVSEHLFADRKIYRKAAFLSAAIILFTIFIFIFLPVNRPVLNLEILQNFYETIQPYSRIGNLEPSDQQSVSENDFREVVDNMNRSQFELPFDLILQVIGITFLVLAFIYIIIKIIQTRRRKRKRRLDSMRSNRTGFLLFYKIRTALRNAVSFIKKLFSGAEPGNRAEQKIFEEYKKSAAGEYKKSKISKEVFRHRLYLLRAIENLVSLSVKKGVDFSDCRTISDYSGKFKSLVPRSEREIDFIADYFNRYFYAIHPPVEEEAVFQQKFELIYNGIKVIEA